MRRRTHSLLWSMLDFSVYEILALLAAISVAIWLIFWIRVRFWDHEDPEAVDHQMLSKIGDLRREGDLSEAEYRSIKSRLVERIDNAARQQKKSTE